MLTDVGTIVLHGGADEAATVSFEAAFGSLVALLVVLGVLWYMGTFQSFGQEFASLEADGNRAHGDGKTGDREAGRRD